MNYSILLVWLAALTCGMAQQATQDLSRYATRDLRKLGSNELATFKAEFKDQTGTDLEEKWGWNPCILAPHVVSNTAWVFVEVYPGYAIPDMSGMRVHFFDKSWGRVTREIFPTGYRLFLDVVTVERRTEFDRPLIVAKVTPTGPFIVRDGVQRPAFEQGDFQFQYYALLQTNLYMIRLEDNHGRLVRNHYRWRSPSKGPHVPKKTKEEWLACLTSTNSIEQLATLVWLTGMHLPSVAERTPSINQESVEDSKLFESVRDNRRTRAVLRKMKKASHPWVREYAKLGIHDYEKD